MEKINFFKTSNTTLSIKEMFCFFCNDTFYEFEDHELDLCPKCGGDFGEMEPSENDCDDNTYILIVDHKTGVPRVVRDDEVEAIMPKNSDLTESTQAE